jgi:formylglycine-generating enzyme required for sulfatase activity
MKPLLKPLGSAACVVVTITFIGAPHAIPDEPANAPTVAADPMRGKDAGEVRDDNDLKMKLVWCPPGFITMQQVEKIEEPVKDEVDVNGDRPIDNEADDEAIDDPQDKPVPAARVVERVKPVKVFITRGYWLGKYEITRGEWKQVMATDLRKGNGKEGDDFPATWVNWEEAMEFCRVLTERERKAGRLSDTWEYTLPTEAQWERACRARTETTYCFGNEVSTLGEYAWFNENASDAGEPFAHRVGQKKANPWGLHDMHGNVWEWCRDIFADTLPGGRDPEVTQGGSTRVIRGASWRGTAIGCRSANRLIYQGSPQGNEVGGFRVALCVSLRAESR